MAISIADQLPLRQLLLMVLKWQWKQLNAIDVN